MSTSPAHPNHHLSPHFPHPRPFITNNPDSPADEGYDEQRFETPSYMKGWSEEHRAGVRKTARVGPEPLGGRFRFISFEHPRTSATSAVAYFRSRHHRHLPHELAIHILTFTDAETLARVALVSWQWNKVSQDQQLWRRFYFRQGWSINQRMIDTYLSTTANTQTVAIELVDGMEGVEFTGKGKAKELSMMSLDDDDLVLPSSLIVRSPRMPSPKTPSIGSLPMDFTPAVPVPAVHVSTPSALPIPAHILHRVPAPSTRSSTLLPIPTPMSNRFRSLRRPSELLLRFRNRHAPHLSTTSATHASSSSSSSSSTSSTITPTRQLPVAVPSAYRSSRPAVVFPHPHHHDEKGRPAICWKRLYRNRLQIERNWRVGVYRSRAIPSAENMHEGHREGIYCVQFDEEKIVSGSRDNTIKVWDTHSGRCLRTLVAHTGSVLCLQYDEKYIISGSSDNSIIQWDVRTGAVVRILKGHTEPVFNLKIDRDHIVSCSKDRTVRVWDLHTGELLRTLVGHRAAVNAVQFRQGLIVSASGDRTVKVWDLRTGECVRTFDSHARGIACVQFDGKLVVSGSSDKTIKVWDVNSGECVGTMTGHTDLVRTVQFDGERGRVVSGSYDETLKVWDWKTGKCMVDLKDGHTSR
ncbi:WD40-repeat-containing domain protein [Jimgerdemannia flammicorona]|uniref:WD40-repeat-containing domain protein n=1 Tax=Jimgerdemannia flammicorona TaxID=994334 RepID=A0A433DKM2_9FUNG|nr:WD40-repeat-containing domain protein [Jimgerdemannia flammicorona]